MLLNLKKLSQNFNLTFKGVAHFGAHLGQEVETYNDLNINEIHLFEPQKKIFKILKKNFNKQSNVYLYEYGLGSKNEIVQLYSAKQNHGASSSILQPTNHLKYYPEISFENNEKIEIKKYDDLNLTNVNFLNIDVQGYELEALKGCKNSLNNFINYIYIEISRKPLYRGGVLMGELDRFLESYGFIRVSTRWASSKIPWGDAFYIQKSELKNFRYYFFKIKQLFEKYRLFYFFIDPYRKFQSRKYKTKQFIKKMLNKEN